MKRVSINIDLKDNEIFDKEVQEIIKAKVKETVRNEHNTMIQEISSKEFERLFEANTYEYKTKLENIVKSSCTRSIKEALEKMDIEKLIQERAEELLEIKINPYLRDLESKCKTTLDCIITKQAAEQIKKILG